MAICPEFRVVQRVVRTTSRTTRCTDPENTDENSGGGGSRTRIRKLWSSQNPQRTNSYRASDHRGLRVLQRSASGARLYGQAVDGRTRVSTDSASGKWVRSEAAIMAGNLVTFRSG